MDSPLASVTPATRPSVGADLRHLGVGPDLRAEHPGGPGQRARHPAHAAAREAPGARRPLGLADVVVQHHVRGPGRPRPGPGADHPGHRQQAEHRVAGEVPLEQVGDAAGEQPRHVHRAAFVDAAQAGEQPRLPQQVLRPPRPEPRRDLVQQRAEHPPDAGQVLLVPGIRVGVRGGEPGDLGVPLRRVVRQPQVAAVGPGREVGSLRVHPVSVLLQAQVADQVRRQQRDDIRQRGHGVVGTERVLADCRPAGDAAPLAHHRGQPGPGQVGRRDQPVVPAAHHHDIRVSGHRPPFFLSRPWRMLST